MGLPSDDAVLIQKGKQSGEPYAITVNCPDKTGLGCDICRIILEFGLYITKGDVSTDGIWCYVVLWVVPHSSSPTVRWPNLKERLISVCPSCLVSSYLNQPSSCTVSSPVYLLTFCSLDRKGLLHDVTQVLCELELTIQRVKVTTTPDGRVLDLFFITDNMELLHTKERQDETCEQLHTVLGESCISCELQLAGPQYDSLQGISTLSPVVSEELFRFELSDKETRSQALSQDVTKLKKAGVVMDNSLSPAHTLLQINCIDHKGFLYDILRTLKDCNIQIAYGRFSPANKGYRDLDLFIRQKDGKKIVDPEKQDALCSRLKVEMLHPLRVIIANRGPDTELLIANPVELSGKGRPRVFYDVTLALKSLGICIFSAEIGRHSAADREWEVYRLLLDENCIFQLSNMVVRNQIVDKSNLSFISLPKIHHHHPSFLVLSDNHRQTPSPRRTIAKHHHKWFLFELIEETIAKHGRHLLTRSIKYRRRRRNEICKIVMTKTKPDLQNGEDVDEIRSVAKCRDETFHPVTKAQPQTIIAGRSRHSLIQTTSKTNADVETIVDIEQRLQRAPKSSNQHRDLF